MEVTGRQELKRTEQSPRPRVLLADDDEPMRARAARALVVDYDVVGSVADGQSTLDAANVLHPDVVVLDITMPHMSGLAVASRLRAGGSRAAIVFLTVHDDEEFVRAARAVGAMGYVVKPRLVSDLAAAVRAALAGIPFVSDAAATA